MTYARLRDVLNMLSPEQLNQEAKALGNGKMFKIDFVDSFRGDEDLSAKFGAHPQQVFLTNNKEL